MLQMPSEVEEEEEDQTKPNKSWKKKNNPQQNDNVDQIIDLMPYDENIPPSITF